jgi:hypothetical protein
MGFKDEPLAPSQEPTDRKEGDERLRDASAVFSRCKSDGVMLLADRKVGAPDDYELAAERVKPFENDTTRLIANQLYPVKLYCRTIAPVHSAKSALSGPFPFVVVLLSGPEIRGCRGNSLGYNSIGSAPH